VGLLDMLEYAMLCVWLYTAWLMKAVHVVFTLPALT
jgi:hypothetical protein